MKKHKNILQFIYQLAKSKKINKNTKWYDYSSEFGLPLERNLSSQNINSYVFTESSPI